MGKESGKKDYSAIARTMIQSSQSKVRSSKPKSKSNLPPQRDKTLELIEALVFALIAAFFLKTFIVEAYHIPTGSMENTLITGDFVLVNKFLYGAKSPINIPFTDTRLPHFTLPAMRPPQRGDIVVFIWPGEYNELEAPEVMNYIKRCVGTPGDTIFIDNKILYVNGQKFYTPPNMQFSSPIPIPKGQSEPRIFPPGARWNHDNYGPLRIPKQGDVIQLSPANYATWEMFIEREGHSLSSRKDGIYIDDKLATSYTVQRNYYFMMGDNRDNSDDSRFWGFVPDDNIVGQAMMIYLSWDQDIPLISLPKKIGSVRWSRLFHWNLNDLNFKPDFLKNERGE